MFNTHEEKGGNGRQIKTKNNSYIFQGSSIIYTVEGRERFYERLCSAGLVQVALAGLQGLQY